MWRGAAGVQAAGRAEQPTRRGRWGQQVAGAEGAATAGEAGRAQAVAGAGTGTGQDRGARQARQTSQRRPADNWLSARVDALGAAPRGWPAAHNSNLRSPRRLSRFAYAARNPSQRARPCHSHPALQCAPAVNVAQPAFNCARASLPHADLAATLHTMNPACTRAYACRNVISRVVATVQFQAPPAQSKAQSTCTETTRNREPSTISPSPFHATKAPKNDYRTMQYKGDPVPPYPALRCHQHLFALPFVPPPPIIPSLFPFRHVPWSSPHSLLFSLLLLSLTLPSCPAATVHARGHRAPRPQPAARALARPYRLRPRRRRP